MSVNLITTVIFRGQVKQHIILISRLETWVR
jgi:hypothetical protein